MNSHITSAIQPTRAKQTTTSFISILYGLFLWIENTDFQKKNKNLRYLISVSASPKLWLCQ